MITTTSMEFRLKPSSTGAGAFGRPPQQGFSLVELMVATAVSTLVMAGVLSALLFMSQAGIQFERHNEMENQGRQTVQRFGIDARQARAVEWGNSITVVLTLQDAGTSYTVTYTYDGGTMNFTRAVSGGEPDVLLSELKNFEFRAYALNGTELPVWSPSADLAQLNTVTKMIQIDMQLARSGPLTPEAAYDLVSARYVLRNKPTSSNE